MFSITSRGSFDKTELFLAELAKESIFANLERYGVMGVNALRSATPVDSGLTAASWYYEIVREGKSYSIVWRNSHIINGVSIAILLQYGHGTGTGGYVQGRDYINPAIRPIFDQIAADVWKVVTSA